MGVIIIVDLTVFIVRDSGDWWKFQSKESSLVMSEVLFLKELNPSSRRVM